MTSIATKLNSRLHESLPSIKAYDHRLHTLNAWWEKITLIGKINSQNVAASILEEMHHTKNTFSELQSRLISILVSEQIEKRTAENEKIASVAIDLLIRNLFERTADVGFLSTDDDIRKFILQNNYQNEHLGNMEERLREYAAKYSVYNEIVILDTKGKVLAHLDETNDIGVCSDALIAKTLKDPNNYVETFGPSDIQKNTPHSLIYSQCIKETDDVRSPVIGVLCLCFKFDDEMDGIFKQLLASEHDSTLMILDNKNNVIASSSPSIFSIGTKVPMEHASDLLRFKNKDYVGNKAITSGYQGFSGLGWSGLIVTPLSTAFENNSQDVIEHETSPSTSTSNVLFSDEIQDILKLSKRVEGDLALIVLNGIIASARQNAVEFMPVLSEVRNIGTEIASIFSISIDNLQSTVIASRMNNTKSSAMLAVDLMDRNLYERANDCRWWALTNLFQTALVSAAEVNKNQAQLTSILKNINDLYTVYTNLYLYDASGTVVAVSNSDYHYLVGTELAANSGCVDALKLKDTQHYSVSDFVPIEQYSNRPTYIYNAAIKDKTNNKAIGGIGIVFDSEPEFKAMLDDSMPHIEDKSVVPFGYFCQKDGLIISATEHAPQNVCENIAVNENELMLENGRQTSSIMQYQGKCYVVGIAASNGYREYKTTNDYQNDIVAVTFIPC
ncbi:cache domain-containing protein [Alteromonas sp. 5E99-2]|uniref:cache domain-containing protein n=1 Tax=Alteromonas sp. 5E99-2 TaxID=2817683 RepID=UPI001A97F30E|nr:cache domain-containing protein [Alteromonas sp. 5E99-2]MBO1254843.1 cache domain-containing protein [Alteromonas sp. 5E99-2]